MIEIPITKTINTQLLIEEIVAAFPEWYFPNLPIKYGFGIAGTVEEEGYVQVLIVPDDAILSTIEEILNRHDPSQPSRDKRLKNVIVSVAQSSVGVRLQDLTAAQVKSLLAVLLWKAGAIEADTNTIRPLSEW